MLGDFFNGTIWMPRFLTVSGSWEFMVLHLINLCLSAFVKLFQRTLGVARKISPMNMPSIQLNSRRLGMRCYCSFLKKYFSVTRINAKWKWKWPAFESVSLQCRIQSPAARELKIAEEEEKKKKEKPMNFYSQCFLETRIITASPAEKRCGSQEAAQAFQVAPKLCLESALQEAGLFVGGFSKAALLVL